MRKVDGWQTFATQPIVGANPEEALWVKMGDGKMMMVDPKIVQNLPEKRGAWD